MNRGYTRIATILLEMGLFETWLAHGSALIEAYGKDRAILPPAPAPRVTNLFRLRPVDPVSHEGWIYSVHGPDDVIASCNMARYDHLHLREIHPPGEYQKLRDDLAGITPARPLVTARRRSVRDREFMTWTEGVFDEVGQVVEYHSIARELHPDHRETTIPQLMLRAVGG